MVLSDVIKTQLISTEKYLIDPKWKVNVIVTVVRVSSTKFCDVNGLTEGPHCPTVF